MGGGDPRRPRSLGTTSRQRRAEDRSVDRCSEVRGREDGVVSGTALVSLAPNRGALLALVGGDDAAAIVADLEAAARTRGEAARRGLLRTAAAVEYIVASNAELDAVPCATWLRDRRDRDIPRVLGGRLPLPLFPPPRIRSASHVTMMLAVADTCSWLPLLATPTDPLGELPGPLPVAGLLDIEAAMAWGQLRYSAIARARTQDSDLIACMQRLRGEYFYETRGFARWVLRGGRRAGLADE